MTTKLSTITAKIINKRFSKAALAAAAEELGVSMAIGTDIFQAMIDVGKAPDFDSAVQLVAEHLDKEQEDPEPRRN